MVDCCFAGQTNSRDEDFNTGPYFTISGILEVEFIVNCLMKEEEKRIGKFRVVNEKRVKMRWDG